jgi:alpha-ketoglutarate-dependent taurine dioxygenase
MSEIQEMNRSDTQLSVRPITSILGAEIHGIDLRRELDPPTVATIRQALLEYKLLVFQDQDIDDARHSRFSRYFGRLTPAHPIVNGLVDSPEILTLRSAAGGPGGNDPPFGLNVGPQAVSLDLRPPAPVGWHMDITFVANPVSLCLLRGLQIPPVGGDTLFVNLGALYESLSPSLRGYLDTLQAIHVRDDTAFGRQPQPRFDGREVGPFAAVHPLVRVHPETGAKHLLLSSGHIKAIVGLRPRESAALLDFLNAELASRADLHARVRWNPGMLVMWDNRAVAHAGPIDNGSIEADRIMHRTSVEGDLPRGPDGFISQPLLGELFHTLS